MIRVTIHHQYIPLYRSWSHLGCWFFLYNKKEFIVIWYFLRSFSSLARFFMVPFFYWRNLFDISTKERTRDLGTRITTISSIEWRKKNHFLRSTRFYWFKEAKRPAVNLIKQRNKIFWMKTPETRGPGGCLTKDRLESWFTREIDELSFARFIGRIVIVGRFLDFSKLMIFFNQLRDGLFRIKKSWREKKSSARGEDLRSKWRKQKKRCEKRCWSLSDGDRYIYPESIMRTRSFLCWRRDFIECLLWSERNQSIFGI